MSKGLVKLAEDIEHLSFVSGRNRSADITYSESIQDAFHPDQIQISSLRAASLPSKAYSSLI